MKVQFNIEYFTQWGEIIGVQMQITSADGSVCNKESWLNTVDGLHWVREYEAGDNVSSIKYNYVVFRDSALVRKEWAVNTRTLLPDDDSKRVYVLSDRWCDIPWQSYLYSSAFTECIQPHKAETLKPKYSKHSLIIKVKAPQLRAGQKLGLLSNQKHLGAWKTDKPQMLHCTGINEWAVALDADKLSFPFEYKFAAYTDGAFGCWEEGFNHSIDEYAMFGTETRIVDGGEVNLQMSAWRGAGMVVPIFSIRTESSFGVGDFGDLKKLIDWVASLHQRVLQILPINDTTITNTWVDSYPYSSISIYAFHPMYANLVKVGVLDDKEKMAYFVAQQKKLNDLEQVDYEAVNKVKREYLHLIYLQDGAKTLKTKGFKKFFDDNADWLVPYAAFSFLRDKFGTPVFSQWPEYSTFNKAEVETLTAVGGKDYKAIAEYYFIQYHLHLQLSEAASYARKNGVIIKGDIPIGINRNSVEAWAEPRYFNMNGQAGAPPDDFSVNGQNWGFPTYNWDAMLADGCKWWMRRFRKMAEYFDAYRIDHILGFFRIWEIPVDAVHGLLGHFSPSLPMSVSEIESYGLWWREDYMTKPFITDWILDKIFGENVDEVKAKYIKPSHDDLYCMRDEYDTQRKVEKAFEGKTDDKSIWIRDGLYALISNVLFVRDHKNKDLYHPRISAQLDFVYQTLVWHEKDAFNRLYNDYFYRRHNQFWYGEAMKKLPMLTEATRMLVCGEDLGMVPDCVPWTMNDLRILSLEIQTMPKNPNYNYGHLGEYPYRSVCTISTHDMSTLRGWWEEDYNRTNNYYHEALMRGGDAPKKATGEICNEVVAQHLASPSMLCILSFQDWLSIDENLRKEDVASERINVPANPKHYWRYRMHLSVEELMKQKAFNERVRNMVDNSGRY